MSYTYVKASSTWCMPGCYDGCGCCHIAPSDKDFLIRDEWDMSEDEHADDIVENIIPRGKTSSPPSLRRLTHTAVLSAVEMYVFNMHEECRRESCPLREVFPAMSQRQHWHWHYAQWLDMYNGLVRDHTFPPTIAKLLLPKIAYQKVNYICSHKESEL